MANERHHCQNFPFNFETEIHVAVDFFLYTLLRIWVQRVYISNQLSLHGGNSLSCARIRFSTCRWLLAIFVFFSHFIKRKIRKLLFFFVMKKLRQCYKGELRIFVDTKMLQSTGRRDKISRCWTWEDRRKTKRMNKGSEIMILMTTLKRLL